MRLESILKFSAVAALSFVTSHAQFSPIELTGVSYNQDIVVEESATPPLPPATTASLDFGRTNTAWGLYEQGYNLASPSTGIPPAGSTVFSETFPDHSYTLAASYEADNGLLIDADNPTASLTPATPTAASTLSFLTAAGNGAVTISYTITHADTTTETGTFVSPDWFGGSDIAVTLNGRVDVVSRNFDNVDSGNPRLYSADITLNNTTSPVTSIAFEHESGGGHAAIFAVSGSSGAEFTPITVTGFNEDFVIEATADQPLAGLNATTATMDTGVANTGATWYEQGYNEAAPTTGLPAPGATLVSAASADHSYELPPSYTGNNAVLVDAENSASIGLATPASFSALSFLTSAGGGAVTIDYTITHADSTTQTGSFVSPDWFNNVPVAFTPNGRVDVGNAAFSAVNSGNPRLYSVDIAVENSTSPINTIDLVWQTGTGHAAILAISGTGGAFRPIFDLQPASTNVFEGTTIELLTFVSGTEPLDFQWQRGTDGIYVDVTDSGTFSGATTTNLTINNAGLGDASDYILVASNSAGAQTSQVARVTVLSDAQDVTSPFDVITSTAGNEQENEPVANAIDNTTTKHLNFGTDGDEAAPFVGPIGLEVTPALGSTIVTGLRVYAANDFEDRDPVDYLLEGSNDGTTFTTISSGPLDLPSARNAAGLDIDPLTQAVEEVLFANNVPYTTYRLSFTNVKNNTTSSSIQFGEIELLGTAAGDVAVLSVSEAEPGMITITSSQPGTLQSTTELDGENTVWVDEGPIDGSVTEPTSGTARFFRVLLAE